MDSFQAPYSVFKDISKLASNSMRYSTFFIDSPLLFIMESQYAPHCLLRKVATLCIILAGSHYLLALSASTLSCRLLRRVNTPRLIYSGEALLTAENYFQNLWRKKWIIHVEYCSPRTFLKRQKHGLPKAQFFTPHCLWQRGVNFLII